jgi:hypothetical protein
MVIASQAESEEFASRTQPVPAMLIQELRPEWVLYKPLTLLSCAHTAAPKLLSSPPDDCEGGERVGALPSLEAPEPPLFCGTSISGALPAELSAISEGSDLSGDFIFFAILY